MVVLAILAASCGDASPKERATAIPSAAGSVEPTVSLLLSGEKFDVVGAYHIRYTIQAAGLDGEVQGDAAYGSQAALYAQTIIADGHPAERDLVAYLFLPPDLYLQQGDGTWFVQSPWNLGVRPGEPPPADPNEPIVSYKSLSQRLHNIEVLADETADGRTLARYRGEIDLSDLPSLAGKGATGSARADIWIDQGSALPDKVEIKATGARDFHATINFVDYDKPPAPPATPADARPFRDAQFPDAPCTGSELAGCLEAQSDIHGAISCSGTDRRVCLVPLGKISTYLVDHLVAYYRNQFGLNVTVLRPASIPADLEDPKRQQVAADKLIDYMGSLFPDAYRDPLAVMIGLTPIDVYDGTSQFRYVFGVKGTVSDPKAVVSSARMDPLFYSAPKDDELFFTRTRKLLSKYVGLLYYGLPASSDPTSPMYDHIGGPDDVDAMTEPLPVPGAR